MHNFVVLTHYQIMHAIAYVNKYKIKSRLFINIDYLNLSEYFIDRLRVYAPFEEVIFLTTKHINQEFFRLLSTDNSEVAFNGVLNPYFKSAFSSADLENDVFFVYNEMQLFYYYIGNFASKIIKVEDGYGSFFQELQIHTFKGQYEMLYRYVGTYFPEIKSKNDKIFKIILSNEDERIPNEYRDKIEIEDYYCLLLENREKNREIFREIYKYSEISSDGSNVLVLTQPLARAQYCTAKAQFLLYKKYVEMYAATYSKVYIKLHPADKVKYASLVNENVVILSKEFPVDVYILEDTKFDILFTLGSTAASSASYADKVVVLEKSKKITKEAVRNLIYSEIKDMESSVAILETDKVPWKIKNKLSKYKIEYVNNLSDSSSEYVTEYKESTNNFLKHLLSFLERDKTKSYDIYQMNIACIESGGVARIINLQEALNRLLPAIIVRRGMLNKLGEDREYQVFTSKFIYYATLDEIKYLISELETSQRRLNTDVRSLFDVKLYLLSSLSDEAFSERYLENIDLLEIEKIIVQREQYLISMNYSHTRVLVSPEIEWRPVIKLIAIKTGLIKLYRTLRRRHG